MNTKQFLYLLLFIFLQSTPSFTATKPPTQCPFVKEDVFRGCATKRFTYEELLKKTNCGKEECVNEQICRYEFKIAYIRQMYNLQIFNVFSKMLEECCGRCSSYKVSRNLNHASEVDQTVLETSDIIFPIFGTKPIKDLHGFHFIPVLEAPSAYYFTSRTSGLAKLVELILGILTAWPLIVITLLLAAISGFIVWLLEKKVNRSEFPKPFFQGMSEGFWWSFISMTTVGYGDKTPRSASGRIYATFWILLGITIFSILTGSLTQTITSIHSASEPILHGKKVGGLKYSFVEATIVAQHGGFYESVDYNDTVDAIVELFSSLSREDTDGVLINRPTYYFFLDEIKKERYRMYYERMAEIETDVAEKSFMRGKLALGMLVKDTGNFKYFHKYFKDNWLQLQICNAFNLNYKAKQFESGSAAGLGGSSSYIIYALILILLVIMGVGWCYERRKGYNPFKTNESRHTEKDAENSSGPSDDKFTSDKIFM